MKNTGLSAGMMLAFAAYAAFSISDAYSKLLAGQIDPFEVAFFGGIFGLLLIPFIRGKNESYRDLFVIRQPVMWGLRAAATFVATAASVEAFMLLPMPEAFSLIFLMPLFVTVLSVVLLREKVSTLDWLSVIVGFVGVLMVLRPGLRALQFGHLCALIAAMANAVGVIAYRLAGKNTPRLSIFSSSLCGPLLGNGALMLAHASWPHGATIWLFLFGYGFLAALGQLLMMMAATRATASAIALPQYSQMLWAVAFSYYVFHELLDNWTFAGIAVIIASGLFKWGYPRAVTKLAAVRRQRLVPPCGPYPLA
ncbi:EamA-like transporter family protein [Komagataeibacter europaeus]|uniref:EamA-like transporter family protein n=1 Tax=Komagataeibacter europaeus TaxID=33995 RepID=A0A0M0EEA8_KOMEU|nr:DMT family transporter [Komagataeibacter europaeus]KON63570.1 EamA-like transporter family protein [Komagataeibacter europaeus]